MNTEIERNRTRMDDRETHLYTHIYTIATESEVMEKRYLMHLIKFRYEINSSFQIICLAIINGALTL